jgi:orotidine-5'-phosphate decarboxylase
VEGSATRVLAVTALTSLTASDLEAIGLGSEPEEVVRRLARLAVEQGIDGFVCAPAECRAVRSIAGEGAVLVVPGVRPQGSARGDQARIATPSEAIRAGANLLVVGRPIRDAVDPTLAARAIAQEIAGETGEAL